jgi:hypothetical protein
VPGVLANGGHSFIVDLDIKHDKNGVETKNGIARFEQWCNAQDPAVDFIKLTTTGLVIRTPGGGLQIHLTSPIPIKQGCNLLGALQEPTGIDTRTARGYGLVPGSIVDGRQYTFVSNGDMLSSPQALTAALAANAEPKENMHASEHPLAHVDSVRALERVTRYLVEEAEPAIQGRCGNDQTFKVACSCRDLGADEQTTEALMRAIYNSKCQPPWPLTELHTIISSVYRNAKNALGCRAPEMEFSVVEVPEEPRPSGPLTPWLDAFNQEYFVADDGGTVRVFRPTDCPGPTEPLWKSYSFEDFRKRYQHQIKPIWREKAGKVLPTDIATGWLNHPKRREFMGGLICAPRGDTRPDQYNTWRGWSIEAKAGSHPLFSAHLKKVICAGNPAHFEYLMGALATMYQKADEPWHIILAIRGPQGCGKGFAFTDQLQAHFGPHAAQLLQGGHLTGRFNSHLRDKILLVANEASFAGDRSHHAFLKGLATERTVMLEEKNRMPVQCKNVAHLIITTNEDWAVPADADDRRMFVLDALGTQVGNRAYFEALDREMNGGGREALLHTFLTYDLNKFNILDVPKTDALAEQKDLSLRGPYKWIKEVLNTGQLGFVELSHDRRTAIPKREVMASYARDNKYEKYSLQSSALAKVLKKVLSDAITDQRPRVKDENGRSIDGVWEWNFAPLPELRSAFERFFHQPLEWDQREVIDPFED